MIKLFLIYIYLQIVFCKREDKICIGIAWTAMKESSTIWKSNFSDKTKMRIILCCKVSVLLYGFIIWIKTKRLEKKLDGNNCLLFVKTNFISTPQNSNCTAIYLLSCKESKKGDQTMLNSVALQGRTLLGSFPMDSYTWRLQRLPKTYILLLCVDTG